MAKRAKSGGPTVVDNTVPVPTALDEELDQIAEWEIIAADKSLGFFDLLRALPDGAWDELMIYLYRLEPAIANRSGEKKYIEKYCSAIDEDSVKRQFGGGKYHCYLKRDTTTVREHKFSIDGPAILQEGQTYRGTGQPAVPPAPLSSEEGISRIVGEVIRATKGDPTAANAGIEIMKKGMMDTLEIQKSMSIAQAGSPTGNPIADKLLDRAIAKLDDKPPASNLSEQLSVIRELAKILKPESSEKNPAPSITEQFSVVKELLGVETLKEVFEMRGGGDGGPRGPWWVSLLTGLVDKMPTMLSEFARMQEAAFQRALIAASVTGRTLPGTILPPAPGVVTAGTPPPVTSFTSATPPPAGAPGTVPAGQISQQMIQSIVDTICRTYDEGYDGDFCAAHLRLSYPAVIEALKPLLSDETQLSAFVASVPELADRAQDLEWPEFRGQFIREMMRGLEPAVMPPQPATVFPNAADVAGETSAPPRKPPATSKKKVNGHGAA